MAVFHKFVICSIFIVHSVLSAGISTCPKGDWTCLQRSLNAVIPTIFAGIPHLGIEPSDPLHVDLIKGNLSIIQYTLNDVVTKGFSKCSLKKVGGDLKTLRFNAELFCPGFDIVAKYVISGRLVIVPIEGKGDFFFNSNDYKSEIEGDLKLTEVDGKTYVAIRNIKLKNEPLAPVTFKFMNLFNGQKDLADAVHKFANENWRESAVLLQDPVWYGNLKKIIFNVNKFLKTVSVDEIMANE